ncbi:MAG: acyl carrier protein [Clostridia bacterium]|jgi:acyl carrier protein|nr:acyl carrier protein [Clostridia bacterium]MBT7122244.1 acyl carrier protein [Clostridia bacterium]
MKEIIIKNLMDQLDLSRDEITMDSKFVDDFEMDSLDMVEMLIDLEKETEIKIPNEDVKDIATVGELLAYLEAKKNA